MIHKINQTLKKEDLSDLDLTLSFKKHRYDINHHCGLDADALCTTIKKINELSFSDEEKAERLKKMYKSLRTRVILNQFSHLLGELITAVFLAGTITIILSSSPAPYALFVSAFILLLTQKGFNFGCKLWINHRLKVLAV